MFKTANKDELEKALIELIWKNFQATSKEDTGLDKNSNEFKKFFSFSIQKLEDDGIIENIIHRYNEEMSKMNSPSVNFK